MSNEKMKREKRMAKRRKDRNIEITLFTVIVIPYVSVT